MNVEKSIASILLVLVHGSISTEQRSSVAHQDFLIETVLLDSTNFFFSSSIAPPAQPNQSKLDWP